MIPRLSLVFRLLISAVPLVVVAWLGTSKPLAAADFEIAAGDWPPFYGETLEAQGVGAQLTRAVFARMGHEVTHRIYPFKRVIARVSAAAVLAADCVWDTPERRQISYLSEEPLMVHDLVVLRRRDAGWSFETMTDLSSKRVAVILGFDYGARLLRNPGIYWSLSPDLPSSIRQVKADRVDFLIDAREVLEYALATEFQMERDELVIEHRTVFERRACYVAFNRTLTGETMAKAFSETLREMKADGSYDRIWTQAVQSLEGLEGLAGARE
ncbi:amino acid ABC transporter substrate-binding protein [Roseibium aquae]|uniref:Amino acid ABC transporter substrate-binding protein n=1 Tax=Roseibium aquae TaxID=1323746 RepID=A0A916X038_9HYPH|nr:transporter substrate-binding domain-containing protein [Roseibium aquae]GGB44078.1 amino acid ABC transporter substrate-binding protein [Roseibium aquae]